MFAKTADNLGGIRHMLSAQILPDRFCSTSAPLAQILPDRFWSTSAPVEGSVVPPELNSISEPNCAKQDARGRATSAYDAVETAIECAKRDPFTPWDVQMSRESRRISRREENENADPTFERNVSAVRTRQFAA